MRSPLTDFGQQNLVELVRLRFWLVLGCLAFVFVLQFLVSGFPFAGLLLLLLIELAISGLAAVLAPRLPTPPLVHALLVLDVAIITAVIFLTGGIGGGFSALYLWVVLMAALLLGLSFFPLYALLVLCGFAANLLLEFLGIHAGSVLPPPQAVVAIAQIVLLSLLLLLAYVVARYRQQMAEQHAQENAALEQSARETGLIFDALQATTSTLELDQVLSRLLEKLVRAFDVTSAYFTQVDEAGQTATISQTFFAETALPAERTIRDWTYPVARSRVIRSLLTGITTVTRVDDPALDAGDRERMIQAGGKTALRVPLGTAEHVVGFLSLWESRKLRVWSPREIRLVETIAAQTTIALANARSYAEARSRTRELEALYASSMQLNSSLSVAEICRSGVESLIDGLGYSHVAIYFTTPEALVLQFERGYPLLPERIPITDGIMARAARTRRPVLVPDVSADPEFISAMPDVLSEISVPLIHDEQVFGVLNVETTRPRWLAAPDVRLLTTFANQLVIAFDKAQLFQETRQRLAELETLHQASAVINADLTLEAVLRRVGDYFLALLAVDTCTICRWDAVNQELYVLLDRDSDAALHVPSGTRLVARGVTYAHLPLAGGKPYCVNRRDPQIDPVLAQDLDDHRWSTLLILPLLGKGKPIGITLLGIRDRARDFKPDEVRLAESLAGQAAIAIENARLYAEAADRLRETEVLYQFTTQLGHTAGVQSRGQIALEAIAQLVPFDLGAIALVDDARRMVVPLTISGPAAPQALDRLAERNLAEDGVDPVPAVVRWVIEHGETVRSGNGDQDPRDALWLPGVCAEVCVPLKSGDKVIGAIYLESLRGEAFDAHAEQLLVTFANQFAIAIVNEQLDERMRQDAEVKAALLRELSHRVKNNLAALASLLQLALLESPKEREQILRETLSRAQSMVVAHSLLAESNRARVSLVALGEQVLEEAVRQLAPREAHIAVAVRGSGVEIAPRQLTTVALVLNELATNAILHGLGAAGLDGHARLDLDVQCASGEVVLALADNGNGQPDGWDEQAASGLGLGLIRTLAEKDLHGSFNLARQGNRTVATLRFILAE